MKSALTMLAVVVAFIAQGPVQAQEAPGKPQALLYRAVLKIRIDARCIGGARGPTISTPRDAGDAGNELIEIDPVIGSSNWGNLFRAIEREVLRKESKIKSDLFIEAHRIVRQRTSGMTVLDRTYRTQLVMAFEKDDPAKTKAFFEGFGKELQKVLSEATDRHVAQLKARAKALDERRKGAERRIKIAADDERNKLREGGIGSLDPMKIGRTAANVRDEQRKIELELVGKKARMIAMQTTIRNLADKAEVKAAKDPVAEQLKKIVHLQERAFQGMRLLVATGKTSAVEATREEVKLAQAEAKLAERLEQVREKASGGLLEKLNAELTMMAIDRAELEARREAVDRRLRDLDHARKEAHIHGARLALELQEAKRELTDIHAERLRLLKEARSVTAPSVTVVGVRKVADR